MNIQQAKQQIIYAMKAYFAKDEHGNYLLPTEKQRPVFMMGAPGIGKTAIIEQIAQELEVGFVSYSMTHHTRQSALGLPFIAKRNYGGTEYDVSEYTMSEIIAAVYDTMEATGKQEGILFLDEINCVSETLTPAMLQFLQYKVFGRHKVPQGWIVVTAGNPPEYNRTVHDFDIATWDRLKRIDVEPDFPAWRSYALSAGVHPSVTTYLDIQQDSFYHVETTVDGANFVTARSWDDLSSMIKLSEANGLPVDELLIGQYLQDGQIAQRFAVYYELFTKYRSDYQVDTILEDGAPIDIVERASLAGFDERIALVGLVADSLCARLRSAVLNEKAAGFIHGHLADIRDESADANDVSQAALEHLDAIQEQAARDRSAGLQTDEKYESSEQAIALLSQALKERDQGSALDFDRLKAPFEARLDALDAEVAKGLSAVENALAFAQAAFGKGQETLILATDLAANKYALAFLNDHPSQAYLECTQSLDFDDRASSLASKIAQIDLES